MGSELALDDPRFREELKGVPWATEIKLQLIRNKIMEDNAKNASKITDSMVAQFIFRAAALELDPLGNQIVAVVHNKNIGTKEKPNWTCVLTIIVTITGMLAIAHRTKQCTGVDAKPLFNKNGLVVGAECTIGRNGHPFVGRAYGSFGGVIKDYSPQDKAMNAATRKALRLAFPEFLGSVYGEEEFSQEPAPQHKATKPTTNTIPVTEEADGLRQQTLDDIESWHKKNPTLGTLHKEWLKNTYNVDRFGLLNEEDLGIAYDQMANLDVQAAEGKVVK